ncbi:MAG: hypothetical protein FIA97_02225 [Methylococcaceae bacterium]|nr:hypothetical protein [Methylococcaceae bacterium]
MNGNHPLADSSAFGHIALETPDATDDRLEIAGLGARSHAFAIDWHIRFLLALTWLLALGFALQSPEQLRKVFDHEFSSPDTWL